VSQLNSCDRALRLYEAGYSGEWLNVLFAPDAHILGSDTTLSRNGCRLHHGEPDPARRSAAEMDQVPIVGQSILGAVLTHRRHNDPIPKGHASDRQRTEEIEVGHFPIMVHARRAAVRRAQAIRDGQLARAILSSHESFARIHESISIHDDDDPPPCSTPMESAIDLLIDGMIQDRCLQRPEAIVNLFKPIHSRSSFFEDVSLNAPIMSLLLITSGTLQNRSATSLVGIQQSHPTSLPDAGRFGVSRR
jgi:hypothetical protein